MRSDRDWEIPGCCCCAAQLRGAIVVVGECDPVR